MVFSFTRGFFPRLVLAFGALLSVCQAQELLDAITSKTLGLRGVHFYGLSGYYGYSTFSGPTLFEQAALPPGANLGSDSSYGVQGSLGWNHGFGGKTTASLSYIGSYGGQRSEEHTSELQAPY